jgi:hypothetical protein
VLPLRSTAFLKLATQHLFQTLEGPPDLYFDELRQDLEFKTGKSVSIPTIWRMLRRAHVLLWKRNAQAHAEFGARIGEYRPDQLVFVDESAFDRRVTYRGFAWSLKGHEHTRKNFFVVGGGDDSYLPFKNVLTACS